MSIYIYKNNQQSGPFDEAHVLNSLKNGSLSYDDLACRTGSAEWTTLRQMYPPPPPISAKPATPVAPRTTTPAATPGTVAVEPAFRKTLFAKLFFGLMVILVLAAFVGALFYLKSYLSPTGNLEADLAMLGYRDVMLYAAIALFVALVLCFLAFLMSFKKKIIASNGVRIVLRVFFILVILLSVIQVGYAAFSYFSYSAPIKTSGPTGVDDADALIRALEQGDSAGSRLTIPAILVPLGFGLFIFGLSGFSMTQSRKKV